MKGRRSKWMQAVVLVVPLAFVLATGCTTVQKPKLMTSHQTETLKARLGTIGVTGARYAPKVSIKTPSKGAGEGAASGMVSGVSAPFAMPKSCRGDVRCHIFLGILATALAPVGAVVGTVGGAITADSAEDVNAREATLRKSLEDLKMQETFRDRVQAKIADLEIFPVELVADQGPVLEGQNPDYRPLKAMGIDTVHEVIIERLVLSGSGKVSPDLAVGLATTVRLVSTTDNNVMITRKYDCESEQDKFAAWAAENARKFNIEIERCYNDLSGRIVQDFYENNTLLK